MAQISPSVAPSRPSKTFDSYEEAVAWRDVETARLQMGLTSAAISGGTVQDYVEIWRKASINKATTQKEQQIRINRFINGKPFGLMPLMAVRPVHINHLLLSTDENHGRVFLANILSKFFRWATDNGYILANPYANSDGDALRNRIKKTHIPKETTGRSWSIDEVWQFFGHEKDPLYFDLWLTILATGLRKGEALGLQWARFHAEQLSITASTNVTMANGELIIEALPKDWQARQLYLGPYVVGRLEQRHEEQVEYAKQFDKWDDRGWIFDRRIWKPVSSMRPGEHLDPANITRRFHAATDRAGLKRLQGPHGLRHTFANLAEDEFKESVIGGLLGHAPSMTGRYTKPTEEELRELALWLDTTLAKVLAS